MRTRVGMKMMIEFDLSLESVLATRLVWNWFQVRSTVAIATTRA